MMGRLTEPEKRAIVHGSGIKRRISRVEGDVEGKSDSGHSHDYAGEDHSHSGTPSLTGRRYPTLRNGWQTMSGYYRLSYRRIDYDGMSVLQFRGRIEGGDTASGTRLFTLPSGDRPSRRVQIGLTSDGAYARALILTDGDVLCYDCGGTIAFDGLSVDIT